ncbi:MAG: diaminopimelate epimerase [Gammaproteobacteria bacterium]|nr:diaminopimelate epimerase [Gammaproteobacteria bacterium]
MKLAFTKMHGLGNDFMVVDLITQNFNFHTEQIRRIADRNKGIGFDQLLTVEPPINPYTDFHFRIYNADGSEVGQCGNGMRCLARFVRDQQLTWKNKIRATTISGNIRLQFENSGLVTVQMGVPKFEPRDIPLDQPNKKELYTLQTKLGEYKVTSLSMGNPHALLFVDDIETAPVETLGPIICQHEMFPEQINVGFIQVIDKKKIKIRVFERGSGETLACGSGACAAMVATRVANLCEDNIRVDLPGGHLFIRWKGSAKSVQMTGPSTIVYRGHISL